MVAKIHSNTWKKVNIIFDIEEIKKKCLVSSDDNASEDGSDGEANASTSLTDLSELDRNLARIRVLLESQYANAKEGSCTYVCADGAKLRLTPFMIHKWCIAIVSATILVLKTLPNCALA